MCTRFYILFCIVSFTIVVSCTKEYKETERSYPRVATGLVTDINTEGVTFTGSFLKAGSGEIIDHGFLYTESSSFPATHNSEKISLGASTGSGSFTATANHALKPGTNYNASAYARSKDKIFYADPVSFVSKGGRPPEIHAIFPNEAYMGDTVTISGKYFSGRSPYNAVMFGHQKALAIQSTDTLLKVLVPYNAMELVDISVTTVEQTDRKTNAFRYLSPIVSSGWNEKI